MKYILTTALALTLLSCAPKMIVASGEKVIIPIKNKKLTEEQLKNWSHLDLIKDTVPGLSLDRAYAEVIKSKKGTKVIVGVIDSGVDVEHKDLRSYIWVNQNEIPNNQIDDDKNNFADDIHGWNFLGDITPEDELFKITYKYIRHVELIEPNMITNNDWNTNAIDYLKYFILLHS